MVSSLKSKLSKLIPKLLLEKLEDVQVIYLFGSQATGVATKLSDIDIAVLLRKKLQSVERWQIQSELANELAYEVDLIDLLSASTVMQNQVIRQGICIYDPQNVSALFEMQVMSMYQHLNDERAEILTQYMGSEP